jgi:hypothetical protein
MRTSLRAVLVAAATSGTLVFAHAALAADSATVAVSHAPPLLAGSKSTTIHIVLPQTDDPIAAINVYAPSGYGAALSQPAGTTIGRVDATAFSHVANLTVPLGGGVVTDTPSKYAAQSTACAGTPASAAVWILNLTLGGQTLALPLYVNPTAGAEQALGAYKLSICLAPWDIPESLGGAAQGAQLLEATFTVNAVFATPTAAGVAKWEGVFTPYTPGKGTPNPAGTFEARAFVPLPPSLTLTAKVKSHKTGAYALSGKVTEGGLPVPGLALSILRGASTSALKKAGSATTSAGGTWVSSGRVKPKTTTYFEVTGSAKERDYTAQGCQSPLTALAPAGCVSATLSPWTVRSAVVRVKP